MTIEKTAPKSMAEALDAGIAAANAGGVPPPGVADDDSGDGGTDDASPLDSGTDGDGAQGAPAGDDSGDQSVTPGDDSGQDGDGADPKDSEAGADGAGGAGDAGADEAARLAALEAGKKDNQGAKKPDPLTDPIPNALKRETKERIRTLVDRTKSAETSLATVTGERDELINAVTETGATPQQYAGVLDYLELVNSGDQNKLKQAANFMIRELSALSRVGGFRIPGVTSYAGHADLEKAVADGKLEPHIAEELAASRAATTHQGKVGAAQAQASQARAQYAQAESAARTELNTIEAEFSKDPLYAAKKPLIVEMLNEQIRGDRKTGIPPLHPSKWPAMYRKIYSTLPNTGVWGVPRPGNVQPGGKVPQNTPLRTQQPAGAQKPEPKSIQEAIEQGIEMARGA